MWRHFSGSYFVLKRMIINKYRGVFDLGGILVFNDIIGLKDPEVFNLRACPFLHIEIPDVGGLFFFENKFRRFLEIYRFAFHIKCFFHLINFINKTSKLLQKS